MRRRVELVGEPAGTRLELAASLDAAFDLEIGERGDGLELLTVLPGRAVDLFVVLADARSLPGLDVVRFVRDHALLGQVPIVFVGGDEATRAAAARLAAELLPADADPAAARQLVRGLLSLG